MKTAATRSLGYLLGALLWGAPPAAQGLPTEAEALRAEYLQLRSEMQSSPLRRPLHLQSQERDGFVQGHIHAVLDQPFAAAGASLSDPSAWCELLLLASNVKTCHSEVAGTNQINGPAARLELRISATPRQTADAASVLRFQWRREVSNAAYLRVLMRAEEGPYGTSDYRLEAQLLELDRNRSLLRLSYEFAYSPAGGAAVRLYLATVARGKVGFTAEDGRMVGGLRGVVERNTMRYLISVRTYLESRAFSQSLETTLQNWYSLADSYPDQLRELTREEYMTMKRTEFAEHHKNGTRR